MSLSKVKRVLVLEEVSKPCALLYLLVLGHLLLQLSLLSYLLCLRNSEVFEFPSVTWKLLPFCAGSCVYPGGTESLKPFLFLTTKTTNNLTCAVKCLSVFFLFVCFLVFNCLNLARLEKWWVGGLPVVSGFAKEGMPWYRLFGF